MEFLRKSAVSLSCFVLFGALASFGVLLGLKQVVGQPQPLENALRQTNAYSALVNNFVQSHPDSTTIGIPLTIPVVQTAVQKAFPPSVVEPAINQLISGTYAWVQGKTATLTFRIDLTEAKNNLANYVQQAATQQAAKLPGCTVSQLTATTMQAVLQDPYSLTCIPPGVSTATVANEAKQAVLDSSFLKDPILTPANLHLASNNQLKLPTPQSQYTISGPAIYRDLIQWLYVTLALSFVCIAIIIWLHRDHFRGLRRAGAVVGWAGLVCIVDAIVIGKLPSLLNAHNRLGNSTVQQITGPMQQTIVKVVTLLAQDFHRWLLWYGIILFVIGLGAWGGVWIWQRRKLKPAALPKVNPIPPSSTISVS